MKFIGVFTYFIFSSLSLLHDISRRADYSVVLDFVFIVFHTFNTISLNAVAKLMFQLLSLFWYACFFRFRYFCCFCFFLYFFCVISLLFFPLFCSYCSAFVSPVLFYTTTFTRQFACAYDDDFSKYESQNERETNKKMNEKAKLQPEQSHITRLIHNRNIHQRQCNTFTNAFVHTNAKNVTFNIRIRKNRKQRPKMG